MSHTTVSRKRYTFLAFLTLFTLLLLSPTIFAALPQTAFLAPGCLWVAEKLLNGFAVLSLIVVVVTIVVGLNQAYTWLTSRRPEAVGAVPATPTPAELEDGTAPTPTLIDLEETAVPAAATTPSPKSGKLATVLSLALNTYVVVNYILTNDVVSLQKPVLENVAAALMFVLRGLEVIFVALLLVGVLGVCLHKRRARAPASAPGTELPTTAPAVVSNEAVAVVVVETPLSKEEKEFMEVEFEKA